MQLSSKYCQRTKPCPTPSLRCLTRQDDDKGQSSNPCPLCPLGGFNFILFGISIGIKRRLIDIAKKNNFLLFAKCLKQFFSHLHFKYAKSAIMTPKKIFLININMGIKKTQNFMLISNSWLSEMPLTKVKSKKPRKNAQKRKYSKIA